MESLSSRSQMLSSTLPPCQRRQHRPHVGSRVVVRASGRKHDCAETSNKRDEDDGEEEDCGMMRWEREYYEGEYGEHICEALALLQSYLMSVRPCLLAGIALLVALSVSISSGLLLFNSIDTMKALFTFIVCVFGLT